ncbi:hypothetical protein HK105_205681 [Polyrhizophydium stewartii]|uniref:Uncharacterized protein n=1 Tax=Polyrhizophydium stewartii TaxID=2732419 RepID=A0ABR4N5L8_9FUNG
MFFRLLVLLLAALVRVMDIVLDLDQGLQLLAPLRTDTPVVSTCSVDPPSCALSIYHGPARSSQPQGWHERVGLVLQDAVAAAASFRAALAAVAPASQALARVPADRGTAPPAQAARCWPRTPRHSRRAEDPRRAEAPPQDPPLNSDDKIRMDESALFMRLRAIMELVGADKELRKVFDALMFNVYVVIFICLLKVLLLLFELLSRIFVTVAGWCGKIQADAEAKAEVDANVDKLKPSCCMNRAKRSKKAKRPHLNDKKASPTTLSNSCEAHPGTTASMHELNVAARPSIFEIAPMHTNNTRPQSLSAASNQPARSLDEIFGLAGSRNINTDGVSAALINKLAKATLSVEHLYMDAAQAPSSARRVPDQYVLMRAVISLHTQATLSLATAAETSASIPPIDDEINTPLDDDLAESHIGGEVGVTEVAVEQTLVADSTSVIQAWSTPVSALIVVPALNFATMLVGTIGAENLLVADGAGVIQAGGITVSVPIVVLVLNIANALENTIGAENLLVANNTGVIQAWSTPVSALIVVPAVNFATMLVGTIGAENLLVADGTGVIQAASTPVSVPCGMPLFSVAALEASTAPENETHTTQVSAPAAIQQIDNVLMIKNKDMEPLDGDSTDSDGDGGDEPRVGGTLTCVLNSPSVIDATHLPKTFAAAEHEPRGMPVLSAAVELESNETSAFDAASVPALKECRRDVPVRRDMIIPEAEPKLETTPRDEERVPAIQDTSASETREIRFDPDWTHADTIKLIRSMIRIFEVDEKIYPTTRYVAAHGKAARSTASNNAAIQMNHDKRFYKAAVLLTAAMSTEIVKDCCTIIGRDSKEKRTRTEIHKPNQAITPLRRAAQHATHTNFTREPLGRLGMALKYLRPAYRLFAVPFDHYSIMKQAAPLTANLKDDGKFQAQYGAVEEPSEPELNEAMLDASHEYHEFVACCFSELCDAILSNPKYPKVPRDENIRWQLGRFWLATRNQSSAEQQQSYLDMLVPAPKVEWKSTETGGGWPSRN